MPVKPNFPISPGDPWPNSGWPCGAPPFWAQPRDPWDDFRKLLKKHYIDRFVSDVLFKIDISPLDEESKKLVYDILEDLRYINSDQYLNL